MPSDQTCWHLDDWDLSTRAMVGWPMFSGLVLTTRLDQSFDSRWDFDLTSDTVFLLIGWPASRDRPFQDLNVANGLKQGERPTAKNSVAKCCELVQKTSGLGMSPLKSRKEKCSVPDGTERKPAAKRLGQRTQIILRVVEKGQHNNSKGSRAAALEGIYEWHTQYDLWVKGDPISKCLMRPVPIGMPTSVRNCFGGKYNFKYHRHCYSTYEADPRYQYREKRQ